MPVLNVQEAVIMTPNFILMICINSACMDWFTYYMDMLLLIIGSCEKFTLILFNIWPSLQVGQI